MKTPENSRPNMYKAIWLSPAGVETITPSGHADGGRDILRSLGVSVPAEPDQGGFDAGDRDQAVYDALYALRWVRVTDESDRIQFTYSPTMPPNGRQLAALKNKGIEARKPVMNDVTSRVLYSPEWTESQNADAVLRMVESFLKEEA